MSAQPLGNLVRITPLDLNELPPHPAIPRENQPDSASPSDSLLTFLLTIFDEASTFLSPSTFSTTFTSLSSKPSLPSITDVELYKREIPVSDLSTINWSENQTVPRKRPARLEGENWFARRSLHRNESAKKQEGTASWSEFVFGLKEQHSRHEQDFTPTIYDARHVLDWNDEIGKLPKKDTAAGEDWIESESGGRYRDVTMESTSPLHTSCTPTAQSIHN